MTLEKRKRGEEQDERPDRYLKLRNILNLIFMIGAIIGVCIYLWRNSTVGTIIILGAMVFKMVECVYRYKK
jgi:hypothetical protein